VAGYHEGFYWSYWHVVMSDEGFYWQAEMEPIYMNELSDGDRSSGYRSSPSIHSEENLYGNQSPSLPEEETLLGGRTISASLEDLGVQDVQVRQHLDAVQMSIILSLRSIAIMYYICAYL
jgi:hypothetical protein